MHYLKKELIELLSEKPDLFDFFQDSISDGLWFWDMEAGDEEWFSDTFWRTLGYDPEGMPTKTEAWLPLVNKDDFDRANLKLQQHIEDPNVPFNEIYGFQHANGSLKYIRCRGKVLFNEKGKPYRMIGSHTDITDYKLTEIKLQEELEFHKFIVNSQKAYIISINPKGEYSFANDHFCEALGLSNQQIMGMDTQKMLICGHSDQTKKIFEQCISNPGQRFKGTFTKLKPDGTELTAEWEFIALFEANNQFKELVGFGIDVTEKLQNEQVIKNQFALLESIQNSSDNPIFAVDTQMNYLAFNQAHKSAMLAIYQSDIQLGARAIDYIKDEYQRKINEKYLLKALEGEKIVIEKSYGLNPDQLQYYELHIFPIYKEDQIIGATFQAINKTELEQANRKFNDLFSKYQNVFEGSQEAIFLIRVDGEHFIYEKVNQAYADIFQLKAEEIEGKTPIQVFGEIIGKTVYTSYKKCIESGEKINFDEDVTWNNKKKIFHTRLNSIRGDQGAVNLIVGVSTDVTDSRSQQITIQKKNEQLLRKEQMLIAIGKATEELLTQSRVSKALENGLKIIQQGIIADQAYYFEFVERNNEIFANHIFECYLDGRPDLINNPNQQSIPLEFWLEAYEKLNKLQPYVSLVSHIPDNSTQKQLLLGQNIKSLVFFPVTVDQALIGFIGFDDCKSERVWSDTELSYILTFANMLSSAMQREQQQNKLIQTEQWLNKASNLTKVGWYEKNFLTGTDIWSDVTKSIHEVPPDFIPDMQTGILFYKEGEARNTIISVVERALATGESFDVELQIVTAKGNERWVRVIGETEFKDGKCIRLFGTYQDIHRSKTAELAKKESEQIFRSIVENAHDLIVVSDIDGVLKYISPQWKEILGYNEEDFLGKTAHSITHPDDMIEIQDQLKLYLESKAPQIISTYRLKHKNGSWKWFQTKGSKVVSTNGEEQIIMLVRDISELKQKETALLKSEAMFRSLVEKSHEGVSLLNKEGKISGMFGKVHLDMGYELNELLGIDPSTLSHPEDLERVSTKLNELIQHPGKSISISYRMRNKDGTYRWILSNITNLLNEPFVEALVFNFTDLTELKNAEHLLVQTKNEAISVAKEYKSILDSQSVYVIKTDLDANYTYVNNYYHLIYGNGKSLIGKNSMDSILPEDHELCLQTVEKCLKEPDKTFEVVLKKPTGDNSIKGSKWEFKAVTGNAGMPTEILCVGFDITNELTSLEKTQKLLAITKNQNQRLIEYTHITSHNLRAPVARILGLCTLLMDEPENLQYRSALQISAQTLDDTIRWMNKLLDIENEDKTGQKSLIDIKKVVNYNLDLFQEELKSAKVSNLLPENFSITAYPLYVDSVINNLISNAVKYKKVDSPLALVIRPEKENEMIGFSVEDNGIGIDLNKYQDKLFKLKGRLVSHVDGKGIGLYFSKRQIEQMGGKILVSSELNICTKFTVLLPENSE